MTDTHPLFADRPELDQLAFAMVHRLHSQIPEEKRPTSWSDFTEAQVLRAKEAAALAYDAGVEAVLNKIAHLDFLPSGDYAISGPEVLVKELRDSGLGVEQIVSSWRVSRFRIRFSRGGGHVHCRLFVNDGLGETFGNAGSFVVSAGREFRTLLMMCPELEVLHESYDGPEPGRYLVLEACGSFENEAELAAMKQRLEIT